MDWRHCSMGCVVVSCRRRPHGRALSVRKYVCRWEVMRCWCPSCTYATPNPTASEDTRSLPRTCSEQAVMTSRSYDVRSRFLFASIWRQHRKLQSLACKWVMQLHVNVLTCTRCSRNDAVNSSRHNSFLSSHFRPTALHYFIPNSLVDSQQQQILFARKKHINTI